MAHSAGHQCPLLLTESYYRFDLLNCLLSIAIRRLTSPHIFQLPIQSNMSFYSQSCTERITQWCTETCARKEPFPINYQQSKFIFFNFIFLFAARLMLCLSLSVCNVRLIANWKVERFFTIQRLVEVASLIWQCARWWRRDWSHSTTQVN